jgi:ABC-2 type transport system permease protein/capsular polysaccharide transport system permease protein
MNLAGIGLVQLDGHNTVVPDASNKSMADESAGASSPSDEAVTPEHRRFTLFRQPLFLAVVALPTLLAVLYFGFIASDVYVSESRFVVRSPSRTQMSPLGALLNTSGIAGPGEETNAVIEYVKSRDALRATDRDGLVRKAFGPDRANWLDRFGGMFGGTSQEHLFRYFDGKMAIETDPTTQVARLSVRAFDPSDARAINRRLIEQSEGLVNQMTERARSDAISVAQKEVDEAKDRAREAAVALSRYRNQRGIVDPKEEAEVRLQMISKLQDELIATRTQLQQMQIYTPRASQIPYLRTRQTSLEHEITEQTRMITGSDSSLSGAAVRYQELWLASQLSEKLLAASVTSFEEAKADARRKRAYVERVAEPSLPDYPMEPRRFRGVLATLLLSLLAWGIASTLLAGIREHRD